MIRYANQWAGFPMIGTSVMKELINYSQRFPTFKVNNKDSRSFRTLSNIYDGAFHKNSFIVDVSLGIIYISGNC